MQRHKLLTSSNGGPQYALQEIEALSLQQMLQFGRAALFDSSKELTSARHAQREVCGHAPPCRLMMRGLRVTNPPQKL
jgi:hypothetical protein